MLYRSLRRKKYMNYTLSECEEHQKSRKLGVHDSGYRDPKTLPTLFLTAPVSSWPPMPLKPMFHAIPLANFSFASLSLLAFHGN